MEHTTGQFLGRGGVTIFTRTWTPAATPRAVVVLAHGYAEHSGRYGHVAAALVDAGYAVAALDHRGHGRSGGPTAVVRDLADLAGDLALLREEVRRGPVGDVPQVLLGHSMGGAVVLHHLVGPHDDVAAAVLSGPYLRNAAAVAAPLRTLAPLIGRLVPALPTQKLDSRDISRDPAVVEAYDADPLVHRGGVPAATGATLLAAEARIMALADRITEPLLILHGTEDRLADVEGSRALAGRVASRTVDLRTYDGLHHEVFNEPERDTVIADVVTWLGSRT